MGLGKSKIPTPLPGQMLMFVGEKDFDDYYASLENSIKIIEQQKVEIDMRTTDLIISLGAENLWEISPDSELIVKMILAILSASGKGDLQNVANLSESAPYIVLIPKSTSKKVAEVVGKFCSLMNTVNDLPEKLVDCSISQDDINYSEHIQQNITKRTIDSKYTMKDKLEAVKIVNENKKIINTVPRDCVEMLKISSNLPDQVRKVFKELSISPYMEILHQRGVQAAAENLTAPKEIVKKFWPIV
ncbi:hypothetical protein SteCoe_10403 [Stentor coeruleus]|uniref:Uncharacterized protein n=1 Tax=Stentor coeruleus TaxID=5963 RepID=A0A1R2CFN3_9CILI|nr:hypothetical protein SteCoe_10403 [Stentor coeruleus]